MFQEIKSSLPQRKALLSCILLLHIAFFGYSQIRPFTTSVGTTTIANATAETYGSNWVYTTSTTPAITGTALVNNATPVSPASLGFSGGQHITFGSAGQTLVIADITIPTAGTYAVNFGIAAPNSGNTSMADLVVSYSVLSSGSYDAENVITPAASSLNTTWRSVRSQNIVTPAANTKIRLTFTRPASSSGQRVIYIDDININANDCGAPAGAHRWVGAGSGFGSDTDFNNGQNWCPATVGPLPASSNLEVVFTAAANPVLSADFSAGSLTVSFSGANNAVATLSAGAHALSIGSGLTANVTGGNINTSLRFLTGTGSVTVDGPVALATASTTGMVSLGGAGTSDGLIRFNGDVNLGPRFSLLSNAPGFEFGKASGTQTAVISPSLTFPSLSITNNATLQLESGTNFSVSGNFHIQSGTLLISAGSGVTGTGTLMLGETGILETSAAFPNFGSSSAAYMLHPSSTVRYLSGSAQQIAHAPAYGNLELSGGSKTVAGGLSLNGNLTVGATATFTAGTYTHNIAGNYSNLGTTNAGSSTVNLGGNLVNNGTLAAGTGTFVFNHSALPQAISGNAATSFHRLTVNKTNATAANRTLLLGCNISVANQLNMANGFIQTGANSIALGSSGNALIETPASYVTGNLQVSNTVSAVAQTFGNIGVSVRLGSGIGSFPATVTRTTGTPVTSIQGNQGIGRTFNISVGGTPPADLNATLTFSFWNHELNGIAPADLVFFRENPAAPGNWIAKGADVSSLVLPVGNTPGSISLSNIPAFSTWTLGNSASPLPVDLMWFTARRNKDSAVLTWATAMEENNAGFAIEASNDSRSFERVGYVTAGTSTNRGSEYTFTEQQASRHGVRYYRLTQHDLDGTVTVLGVRTVTFDARGTSLATGPNPFAESFTASIESDKAQTAFVTLTDALGRVVAQRTVRIEKGSNAVAFDGHNLGTGIYLLSVQLETEVLSGKLIRQ